MAKRNIINFEDTFTKFYDKINTIRKFYGSSDSLEVVLALRNGDVLAVLSIGYGKSLIDELMSLRKFKCTQRRGWVAIKTFVAAP